MLAIPHAAMAAVLKGMSFVLIILALGCMLSAAFSVLWIVGSLLSAVLKLFGVDSWAGLETGLYGVVSFVTFVAAYFVLIKTSYWAADLATRIESRAKLQPPT